MLVPSILVVDVDVISLRMRELHTVAPDMKEILERAAKGIV